MANHIRFCPHCKGWTAHNITYDIDSDTPEEAQFEETCLRCAGFDDYIETELTKSQTTLNL